MILQLNSIDDFSVVAPEDFDAEQTAVIEQVPIIKQRTNTFGISWTKKFTNGNGRILTTLSSNELKNQILNEEDEYKENNSLKIPGANDIIFNLISGFSIRPFISNWPANNPSFFKPVNNSPTAGTTLIIFDINFSNFVIITIYK